MYIYIYTYIYMYMYYRTVLILYSSTLMCTPKSHIFHLTKYELCNICKTLSSYTCPPSQIVSPSCSNTAT